MEWVILSILGYYALVGTKTMTTTPIPAPQPLDVPITQPVTLTAQYPFLNAYMGHALSLDETHRLRDAMDQAFKNTKWSYPLAVTIFAMLAGSIAPNSRWGFWIYPKVKSTNKLWRDDDPINGSLAHVVKAQNNGNLQQKYYWQVVMRWNPESSWFVKGVEGAVKLTGKAFDQTLGKLVNKLFGVDVGSWVKDQFKGQEDKAKAQISSAMANLNQSLGSM